MKKTIVKLIALLVLLATTVLVLASCGTKSVWKRILNPKYEESAPVYSSGHTVTSLQGYTLDRRNAHFAIFSKPSGTDKTTWIVYSLKKDSIVLMLTDSSSKKYYIYLTGSLPVFVVSEASYNPAGEKLGRSTHTLYDLDGKVLGASNTSGFITQLLDGKMFLFDDYLCKVADDDSVSMGEKLPPFEHIPSFTHTGEKYLYVIKTNSVEVYDRDLTYCCYWKAPQYVEYARIFPLNNGNVLIQYFQAVDSQAKTYDVLDTQGEAPVKYDLVTLIMQAKNGKLREINMNAVVNSVGTYSFACEIAPKTGELPYKENSFENLASVTYLSNGRYERSDFVLLSNRGKIQGSVMLFEEQSDIMPTRLADDLFYLNLQTGVTLLLDGTGRTLKRLSTDEIEFVGGYIVTDRAIYAKDLTVFVDLEADGVTLLGTVGDAIFFKQESDTSAYTVYSLHKGAKRTVFEAENGDKSTIRIIDDDVCEIYDGRSLYSYYGATGKLLAMTNYSLQVEIESEELQFVLMSGTTADGDKVYYRFSEE